MSDEIREYCPICGHKIFNGYEEHYWDGQTKVVRECMKCHSKFIIGDITDHDEYKPKIIKSAISNWNDLVDLSMSRRKR